MPSVIVADQPATDIVDEFNDSLTASEKISAAVAERRETLRTEEAKSPYAACVEIIKAASKDWLKSRRMTYAAIYEGGLALPHIFTEDFKKLCEAEKATKAGGKFPQTRLVYMFAKGLKRDRRADVAGAMCWMHTPSLCGGHGGDDTETLIDYFIEQGGIDKCAKAYREWITKHGKPGDFGYQTEGTTKGTATRRAKGPRRLASATLAAVEARVALSREARAKIDEAEGTSQPTPKDEEFLETLNLRDAVDRRVANLKPITAMGVGKRIVPDVGVYIIRKVDAVLTIYGPVIDETVIRAALRSLPEG
jgi:hypothetical protein